MGLTTALLLGVAGLLYCGISPVEAIGQAGRAVLGSWSGIAAVLAKSVPLAFCGLAVALAGAMRLWNVGAEGQLALGAMSGAGFALYCAPDLPAYAAPALALLAAALGGALWAAIPGLLKVGARVNEVLSTLFLNYVAAILLTHLYYGPWRDPAGFGFPSTALLPQAFWLPRLPGTTLSLGLPLALLCAFGSWLLLRRTRWGFEILVAGASAQAARYDHIPVARRTLALLALSGAMAGLAGGIEVLAVQRRLQDGLLVGHGYAGLLVAFLARLHPLGLFLVALLLGAFLVGVEELHLTRALPSGFGQVLEAGLLLGFLVGEAVRRARFNTTPPPALPEESQP
jgi:simple sugar transport system permease protein